MFSNSYIYKAIAKAKAAAKKTAVKAKKEVKKEEKAEEAPEDETETSTISQAFNGADEEEVMEKIFGNYAKESYNAAGQPSGEKVLFKEDAEKAGKEIIETTKGVKGSKLTSYMKQHFDEAWKQYDMNDEGSISLEEAHTFQRSLMGRLNNFVLA